MAAIGAIPSAKPRIKKRESVDVDALPPVEDKSSTPNGDMRSINRASAEMKRIGRTNRMRE